MRGANKDIDRASGSMWEVLRMRGADLGGEMRGGWVAWRLSFSIGICPW